MARRLSSIAVAFCALTVIVTRTALGAGGDKVVFPANYVRGVMYTYENRADEKEFREFYITPGGFAAAKKGEPLPSGTVVTLARYNVQLDGNGKPLTDAEGRFIKTSLKAFRVMETRTGWGSEYPDSKRNGEWEYQAFLPDGKVDAKANIDSCFTCHKNGDSVNFMFTADRLKSAAR
jgi:Cytochrome P460